MKKIYFVLFMVFICQANSYTQSCLPDGISFLTQEEIDNFQLNYPNCTEIEGSVEVYFTDITNLDGLNVITSIGEELVLLDNDALTNISGLIGLTSVGGDLIIQDNNYLSSLDGLNNLTSIGGELVLIDNFVLSCIDALKNINHSSIINIYIIENYNLSNCAIKSICDYLASPGGTIEIYDNDNGCNSPDEVEYACEDLSIDNVIDDAFLICPNPAKDEIFIEKANGLKIEKIIIYNQFGQKVINLNEIKGNINISKLEEGIYIMELTSGELKVRQKLIISG